MVPVAKGVEPYLAERRERGMDLLSSLNILLKLPNKQTFGLQEILDLLYRVLSSMEL